MRKLHVSARLISLLLLAVLLIPALAVSADPMPEAATYELSWWTADGGGTSSAVSGSYTLGGTIGQPDAAALAGGAYVVSGGFWNGSGAMEYRIYVSLGMK